MFVVTTSKDGRVYYLKEIVTNDNGGNTQFYWTTVKSEAIEFISRHIAEKWLKVLGRTGTAVEQK